MRTLSERSQTLGRKLTASERLETIAASARQMSRPIAFGIGIILIVFFPILTLEGIEGKMFKPMAWTFIFALIGALIIALVLSPVLGYYFLPNTSAYRKDVIDRTLVPLYSWLLEKVMRVRWWVLPGVAVLLLVTVWQATRLGGEFLPRLSEGAITINTIRLAGISIDQSVDYNTRIEQLLLDEFPDEIRHVWSRIGTAEVATDPMGTELTDIFVSLTPRDTWTQAHSQAELVAAVARQPPVPGTQPPKTRRA